MCEMDVQTAVFLDNPSLYCWDTQVQYLHPESVASVWVSQNQFKPNRPIQLDAPCCPRLDLRLNWRVFATSSHAKQLDTPLAKHSKSSKAAKCILVECSQPTSLELKYPGHGLQRTHLKNDGYWLLGQLCIDFRKPLLLQLFVLRPDRRPPRLHRFSTSPSTFQKLTRLTVSCFFQVFFTGDQVLLIHQSTWEVNVLTRIHVCFTGSISVKHWFRCL